MQFSAEFVCLLVCLFLASRLELKATILIARLCSYNTHSLVEVESYFVINGICTVVEKLDSF